MNELDRLVGQFADVVARRVIEMQKAEAAKNRTVYLTPEQMAERLGIKAKTLANMRSAEKGPKFVKVGGRVRYVVTDAPAA